MGHLLDKRPGREGEAADGQAAAPPSSSRTLPELPLGLRTPCLMGLVSFLVSRPEVARLSALPRARPLVAVASSVVQSGEDGSTPLWDRGVDGTGQVVQVRMPSVLLAWGGMGWLPGGGRER